MKNKKEILNQINSYKNRIIKGEKEGQVQSIKDAKTMSYKIDKNLLYVNNISKGDARNTTVPNAENKRIKGSHHLRITAKNKENNNNNMVKNNREKLIPKKIIAKSLPKNVKPETCGNNTKPKAVSRSIKKILSSNNINIIVNKENQNNNNTINNRNPITILSQKKMEEKEIISNRNGNENNNTLSEYRTNNNIIREFKNENFGKNGPVGVGVHPTRGGNLEEISANMNINRKKANKSSDSKRRGSKGFYSTVKSVNNKSNDKNSKMNNYFNNNHLQKQVKRSPSIDIELSKLIIRNSKEIKKCDDGGNKINRAVKNNNNNVINNHQLENEKGGDKVTKYKNNIYQYLILKGNASYLVKYCMCHRTNWVEAENPEPDNPNYSCSNYNFKWKEVSYGINYNKLNKNPKMKQMVNHFEFHSAISNKGNMFINLMKYCERRNLSIFKYVPFTIVFKIKDRRKIKNKEKQKRWTEKLEKLKKFIQDIDKNIKNYNSIGDYYKDEEYIKDREKRIEFEILKEAKKASKKQKKEEEKTVEIKEKPVDEKYVGKFQVYSDVFPRLKLSDKPPKKNKLTETKDKDKTKEKGKEKKAIMNKIIGSNTIIEIPETHYQGKNMWVLKAVNLNRGMCIRVVNSFQQMEKVINKFKSGVDYSNFTVEKIEEEQMLEMDEKEPGKEEKENNTNNNEGKANEKPKENNNNENENEKEEKLYNCTRVLIQKYIENPLLYKGRKCDMRIWVLLTHQMKVFIFKEGHLKTCSVEYDINSQDAFTHITNYSFQKHNNDFQKFEKGNEVPFYEFQKFIDEKYPEKNYKLNRDLMKQIKEIISVTMRCVKNKINRCNRNFQFEIFGYDFMLDADFNAFLIEINTNPGLEISSPWIQIVVPRMLDDALRLTLDKVFEPVYDFSKNYKGDYTEEQKKALTGSKIAYDFNAVKPNEKNNNNDKQSNSASSSTLSQFSASPPVNKTKKENNILSINLELDDFDKKLVNEELNINENNSKEKEEKKEEEEVKKIKINEENKTTLKPNKNKKQKYISPFPVPGYSLDANLWDFVCDLNDKDPFEVPPVNDQPTNNNTRDKHAFTGIRHLLKKRKDKPKKEKKSKSKK